MNHPKQIVRLAHEASALTEHPAQAADLLIDAVALLCIDAKLDPSQFSKRLSNSHVVLNEAHKAVIQHGTAATLDRSP